MMRPETPERVVKRWLHPSVDESWKRRAACRDKDPALWFPDDYTSRHYDAQMAKAICWSCPVRIDCLIYALAVDARYGTYGGMTASERNQLAGRRAV
jgi:WhiB family redox-sensing transcriptional regulator